MIRSHQNRMGMGQWEVAIGIGQCGLLLLIGTIAAFSWPKQDKSIPSLRLEPLNVSLAYDWPQVVTDEQLDGVLHKLRPRLNHPQPKINHIDHALRMWGKQSTFADPECLSGQQMIDILTNTQAFQRSWETQNESLLSEGEFGIGFRTQDGEDSASHVDHTLGTLAEIGVSLDAEVIVDDRMQLTIRDLLTTAMRDFRLNQKEYEWTTVATASYATGPTSWVSQDGEIITFDLLAKRIMRQDWEQGVCFGYHRLYSLALLLQLDDQIPLFRQPTTRVDVVAHLSEATKRLMQSQSVDGYWDQNWPDASRGPEEGELDGPLQRRILATGHTLEWWAIAPPEVLPERENIVRAAQWLVAEVENMEPENVTKNYTFLSHVGRALCLWRGKFPHEFTPLSEIRTETGSTN